MRLFPIRWIILFWVPNLSFAYPILPIVKDVIGRRIVLDDVRAIVDEPTFADYSRRDLTLPLNAAESRSFAAKWTESFRQEYLESIEIREAGLIRAPYVVVTLGVSPSQLKRALVDSDWPYTKFRNIQGWLRLMNLKTGEVTPNIPVTMDALKNAVLTEFKEVSIRTIAGSKISSDRESNAAALLTTLQEGESCRAILQNQL